MSERSERDEALILEHTDAFHTSGPDRKAAS
jgi:hypothetical protein